MKCSEMNCNREAITAYKGSYLCEYHRDRKGVIVNKIPDFEKLRREKIAFENLNH